jgi:hypothetical protein
MLSLIFFILQFLSVMWVLLDSHRLGAKRVKGGGFFNMSSRGWFFSCALLWIVFFPIYLFKRQQYKREYSGFGQELSKELLIKYTIILISFYAVLYALGSLRDFMAEKRQLDVNNLPRCDSEITKETVQNAVINGPMNKIYNFNIISFEQINTTKHPEKNDKETFCKANVLTNAGRREIFYTILKTADDDSFYVEVSY